MLSKRICRFTYIIIILLSVTGIYSNGSYYKKEPLNGKNGVIYKKTPLNVKISKISQYGNLPGFEIFFKARSKSIDADSVMLRYKLNSPDSTYPQSHTDGNLLSKFPHTSIKVNDPLIINGETLRDGYYFISAFVSNTSGNWSDYSDSAKGKCRFQKDFEPPENVKILQIKQSRIPQTLEIKFEPSGSGDADSVMLRYKLNSPDSTYPQSHADGIFLAGYPHNSIRKNKPKYSYVKNLGYYYISAFVSDTSGNWSGYSDSAKGKCIYRDYDSPENIESLRAEAQDNRTIKLTWSPSTSEDAEIVRICYDTIFNIRIAARYYKEFDSKDTTGVIKKDIVERKKYYINAFVRDSSENWSESSYSARDTVTIPDRTPPLNVTDVSALAQPKRKIKLSWIPSISEDADSLIICWSQVKNSWPQKQNEGESIKLSHSITDSTHILDSLNGISEKTTYYFSLFVKDDFSNWSTLSISSQDSVTTLDETPPDNITGLTVRAVSKDSIILSWSPSVSNDADSIMIRYNTDGTFPNSISNGSLMKKISHLSTSDTLTGLNEKTMYHLSFFVRDTSGNWSSFSGSAADSIETLDETPPDILLVLKAKVKSTESIELSWGTITSTDVATVLLIYGENRITGVEDTSIFYDTVLSPSTSQFLVKNLNSNTNYHFALFLGDKIPNWSSPAYDSSRTLNNPPVCVCFPVENEQSMDVTITYKLTDVEHDELSIEAYFSLDGNEWTEASISGDTNKILPPQYVGTIKWHSNLDLPNIYSKSVLFTIVPYYDKQRGRGNTVQLTVDNSHIHTVELKTPEGRQTGNIIFPYTVIDSTNDTLIFSSYFSIDTGTHWTATEHVYPRVITPQEYSGSLKWDSDSDIGEKAYDNVQFAIVSSDGWEDGFYDTTKTSFFSVDNTPIIEFIDTPSVIDDTVECAIRIISRKYDSLSHLKSFFSYDGNKKNIAGLSRGTVPLRNPNDSMIIKWPSKNDFTSNSSEVSVHFQFSVGIFEREIESPAFSLNNNEIPKITISEMSSEQYGDVTIIAHIEDTDQDPIRIIVEYFDSNVNMWKKATLESNNLWIDPLKYNRDSIIIIWKSASDIPNSPDEKVSIRIFPFDEDTGNVERRFIKLINQNVPVCAEILISNMDTLSGKVILSDKIQIIHILKDNKQDLLDLDLSYFLDSQWIKTENIYGKRKNISNKNYTDTIIWFSSIDFPDTVIPGLKLKLVPKKDTITGQSGLSRTFKIDNTLIFPEVTGDFNGDNTVDIEDFNFASRYWHWSTSSEKKDFHPDSIQELAPANGTPPYKIVMPDSKFDHNDLKVFTELCYWWFDNSPPEKHVKHIRNNITKRNNLQVISHKRSSENSEIDLQFKIRDIHDLNFCRYRVFVDTPHVSFKKIYVRDTWDFDPDGTIQSLILQDSMHADIGISRFSDKNIPYSGSTDIADVKLVEKSNSQNSNSFTVFYELFNSNNVVIESGSVQLTIPETGTGKSYTVEKEISVFPNPSVSNRHAPLFTLIRDEATKRRFENSKSGFFFQIPIQDIDWENSISASIKIFDALGNTVAADTELNLITGMSLTFSDVNLKLYWNGCNTQGRKLGSGVYKAMIVCRTDRASKIFYADIGVK